MSRYIDADRAKCLLDYVCCGGGKWGEAQKMYIDACKDFLDGVPTADVQEVKRGGWKYVDYGGFGNWHCTACGKIAIVNGNENFCPNCGARMEDGDE